MYSYNHIDIKKDKFRLIPVEPTQIAFNSNINVVTPTQILDNGILEYTYKFKGLSYRKYQYYLISVINFHDEYAYSTITNKIYRKPIILNHSLYNVQKSYMLVIPKTNTPIESNSLNTSMRFLVQPTNIRLCELNGGRGDIITSTLFSLTCVDKSGYNVNIRRHYLLARLRAYKQKKRVNKCYKNK